MLVIFDMMTGDGQEVATIVPTTMSSAPVSSKQVNKVKSWTKQEVTKWLQDAGIHK